MALQQIVPRVALILIFLAGAVFAFIESAYMRDHAAALGPRGGGVSIWMWVYRAVGIASFFAASFVAGSFFRR
ncbi:MAG TPA: hypothetical protein VEW28_10090 [Candidatus Kapabacteria bacterium]|nr:hypothetical protein [Candidatus Kapabacteria bacterium]